MRYIYFFILFMLGANVQAQTLQHTELLGRPTANSITVQAFFNSAVEVCVQYGTTSGVYPNQTAWQTFAANDPAEIVLTGLQSNTKYFYRMCHRVPGTTAQTNRTEHFFHTQRPAGEAFSFIVQADPHVDEQSDTALYRRCLRNQLEDNPDFMIDLGDFLMSDKLKNNLNQVTHDTITYRCHLMRSFYETSCHSVPLFIALGNHEGEAGWLNNNTANNIPVWGTNDRKKYYLNPAPDGFYSGDTTHYPYIGQRESYYTWQWGDAQFIVIDPYWSTRPKPDSLNGWRWTLGKAQYDWLKQTLESSTAKFKFVFSHQIVGGDPDGRGGVEFANRYEWGGDNLDGTSGFATKRPGWYKPIKDLLAEHHVNIFFHGHDHFFGKQQKDCLIYQETPQPSHPNFTSVNYAQTYGYLQGQIQPNSGHLRVTVDGNGTRVDYVRAYLPPSESGTRHNKDVSATYFIGATNCYDSLTVSSPIIWNSDYSDELVYPNPFEQETKIEFSLRQADHLSIAIYNQQGQLVRQLLDNQLVSEGKFQVNWDGKNATGAFMSNGMYLYTIKNEKNEIKSGRMVLMR